MSVESALLYLAAEAQIDSVAYARSHLIVDTLRLQADNGLFLRCAWRAPDCDTVPQ